MEYNKKVGINIYNARKKLRMSRAVLGSKIGLHETTIKKYEDGDIKSIDIEKIKEFAKALDTSASELLEWNTEIDSEGKDADIVSIERAKRKMPEQEQDRMMEMLKLMFREYFD